ncbi:retrovirus-related pol polyprotein from transposon TNT 1-94 [Tanacetum coccineum]
MSEDKVKKEIEEIETINIELDHRVSKLIAENEHLKHTYKQLYDSIKPTRIRSKEQCDALINQVNQKSLEISDLNVSLQEKDLVITSLKDELRKLKGKDLVDNVVTKHTITPEMLKIDVEPIAPRLLKNRTTHSDYLSHTQEQAAILREIVEQGKSQNPLNNSLDSALVVTLKNKDKRVRFTKPVTSSGNTNTKTASSSNKPMLSSTGVKPSTSASGSQPSGNQKKDKIHQTPSKKFKEKSLKPTRKVFTNIGYTWRPTGRTYPIVSNVYPLTRITTTAEVPLRKLTALETDTPKPVVTLVYSRKPRKSKTNVPVIKPKIIKSISANNKEPSKSWGSIVSGVPSSSLDECRSSKLFSARHGLVRGLSKLKFEKDHLCFACAMGKSKKKPHKPKSEDTNQEKLYLLHMDLCGLMRVAIVNGKKYILVIVDDYSRLTWVKCLRTDNGTEFLNQTLREYYEKVDISHETFVACSPEQNGVVKRRNRMLIRAARTMLIYAKASLFLWAKAVATACYTQNRSIIRLRHGKTPYEILHDKLPDLSFFHVFGALCYLTNDSENLGKRIIETIHVDFDELTVMASEHSKDNHDLDVAHMNNDPFFGIPIPENASEASSCSDVISTIVHTAAPNSEHITKWTKDHPLDNIIGELERPVSTRLQLHEQALFCYYDAFLTSVEPKNYKGRINSTMLGLKQCKRILMV